MKPRIISLTLLLLLSLITCNSPSTALLPATNQAAGKDVPSRSGETSTTSDPELPRDFNLPIPLFTANAAWNQTAASAAVLPTSDQQILTTYRVLLGDFNDLVGYTGPATTWPFLDINIDDYSVPIFRAGTAQNDVWICADEGVLGWPHPKFGIDTLGGPVTVPAPAGTVRPAGPQNTDADGHLVLYDANTFTAYDYFYAITQHDGQCLSWGGGYPGTQIFEAGEVDFFDVRGKGTNYPEGYSSARAHGTPLLAGMILPEDIESGAISHALAFAIPGPRNLSSDPSEPDSSEYFYPASTTETDFYSANPYALIAGQRIRLKQTLVDEDDDVVDESQLAPITQMFFAALRNYGAYLVDNAGGFSFYAEDIHTANLNLTDDQVNALIGQPPGTPLPADMTKWQIVLEQIHTDMEVIPFASGPGTNYQDPANATITTANYEMVEPATHPDALTISIYLPTLRSGN
ncbi:MAG: hypothetical protein GY796_30630 [Chloroflexi bacterium]|nr:hypothetical protein [Chloroflexota bacterium]